MRDDHCVRTCPNGRHQYILRQCRHTRPKSKRPVGYMYVYALVLNGRRTRPNMSNGDDQYNYSIRPPGDDQYIMLAYLCTCLNG